MSDLKAAAAYDDGYKNGRLDRVIGTRSEYSYNARHDGGYPSWYGQGYYDAQNGLASNNPWAPIALEVAEIDELLALAGRIARERVAIEREVRGRLTLSRAFTINRLRSIQLGLRGRTL